MGLMDKLTILADAAKYDAACTSSGLDRAGRAGRLGSTMAAGCCHSFSADGRCISLLKILYTNICAYDCQYCVNRRSSDPPRAAFTPRELAELTIQFYRRNYIEGLFLSSAVLRDPDYTTERMIEALRLLRQDYGFGGYIHAKAIPGADPLLTQQLGLLLGEEGICTWDGLGAGIRARMAQIRDGITQSRQELAKYHHAPRFAPAGQSTQMIVGATPESDRHILMLTQGLYDKYHLKRVFYSAYIPVSSSSLLPAPQGFQPPLLREHRLFPVEVQRADYEALLRVPGIGVTSAKRILTARRAGPLSFSGLKKLGVVLKRAQYFITCSGRMLEGLRVREEGILSHLAALERPALAQVQPEQLSLFGEEGAS